MTTPLQPTSASAWKQASEIHTLPVPSGNVCRARKEGLKVFVKTGIIPNSLMPIVLKAMKTGSSPALSQIEKDPQKVQDALLLIDRVVVHAVIEPKVLPVPRKEDPDADHYDPDFERDPDALYVDDVDMDDKVFIFQWACGGTSDLETFRGQTEKSVGAVSAGENVAVPAKRSSRARKR